MSTVFSDLGLLHPKFRAIATAMQHRLALDHKAGKTKTLFKVFETYRSPSRQRDLIAKGVTKAGPYESAHQYGLAVDFVPVIDAEEAAILSDMRNERRWPGWSWDDSHEWDYLTNYAKRLGLTTITWDRPHIEHPEWGQVREKMRTIKQFIA